VDTLSLLLQLGLPLMPAMATPVAQSPWHRCGSEHTSVQAAYQTGP